MDNPAGKRRATTDLNHDNWDQDIEPEKKGTFQTASEDELKNRVIKKARRKLTGAGASTPSGDDADGQKKSVFSGFAGFGKTPSTASTATTFSSVSTGTSNTFSEMSKKSEENKPANVFSFLSKFTPAASEAKNDLPNESSTSTNNNNYNFTKSNTYYAKLKGLNQAVSSWIKTHVDKNPLCLLTPIFQDYEKYLKEIEKNEGTPTESPTKTENNQSAAMSSFKFSATPAPTATFSFGNNTAGTTTAAVGTAKTSIFGDSSPKKPEEKSPPAATTTGFSFGIKSDTKANPSTSSFTASSSTGFSFSGGKPFSFANIVPPPAAEPSADKENGDEEDEPPKVEFKAVVEEDSVYSHRCKVFVKSGENFADRGVGTLYLKPVKDSEKMQLLVRADTNLGNILVNLILNDSIPTQRMGKNNVMMVCIPNPDIEKPTPMLLRVKTAEEADKLLEIINKYKK